MSKRDAFWESVQPEGAEFIDWPEDPEERAQLAGRVIGACFVGALESVLVPRLQKLDGVMPEPGAHHYARDAADVKVLQSLNAEQKAVVARLLRETAYFAGYWPLVKLRDPPSLRLDFNLVPIADGEDELPSVTLNEDTDLHLHFHVWLAEFADVLSGEDL